LLDPSYFHKDINPLYLDSYKVGLEGRIGLSLLCFMSLSIVYARCRSLDAELYAIGLRVMFIVDLLAVRTYYISLLAIVIALLKDKAIIK